MKKRKELGTMVLLMIIVSSFSLMISNTGFQPVKGRTTSITVNTNWTWVSGSDVTDQNGVYGTKGVAAASNVPGTRDSSISWTGSNGDFWLFGGYGYDASGSTDLLNDLWKSFINDSPIINLQSPANNTVQIKDRGF